VLSNLIFNKIFFFVIRNDDFCKLIFPRMSKKSAKRRLSFDDSDSLIIDDITPGPSKPTTSHALNDKKTVGVSTGLRL